MKPAIWMLCGALSLLSTAALALAPDTEAVEFYDASTQRFFVTASAAEAAMLDANPAASWMRTGRSFQAWTSAASAPAEAQAVCRFYSPGMGSHFLTANVADCNELKGIAAREKAAASSPRAWQYEGIAFYALAPKAGRCDSGTSALVDMQSGGMAAPEGFGQRFVDDPALIDLMRDDAWSAEGVAFCATSKSTGTNANLAPTAGAGALVGTWSGDAQWETEANGVETRTTAPLSFTIADDGTVIGTGNGCTFTGQVTLGDGFRSLFSSTVSAAGCTNPAFNGDYRRVRLERFGPDSLVARLRKGDGDAEASISARLVNFAATTPPSTGALGAIAGDWTGTVGWQAEGQGQPEVDVNKALSLSISSSGAVSGSGFGCVFTGSVSRNLAGRSGATGHVSAAGCDNAVFNGDFNQVRFNVLPNSARLQVRMSRESGGVEVKIEGALDSGSASTPAPPVAPTASIAGTWSGNVGWLGVSRDPSLLALAVEAVTLTIGSEGAVSGSGFGCTFSGQLTLSANGRSANAGQVSASGCTKSIFNGVYASPRVERNDGALEVELEREDASAKVKIAGKLAAA